jgi:hypothetical protein
MANRTGNLRKGLAAPICILGIAGCMAVPASAGAEGPDSLSAMTLVFTNGKAHDIADNVAVPVECLGDSRGFCSGVVTLSRAGHRISIPFSVRGGGHESLFVPLRLGAEKHHPRRVHGVATTAQQLGPPTSTQRFLLAE